MFFVRPDMNHQLDPATRQSILDIYESGQYLQAYRAWQQLGPLDAFAEPDDRVLAGRLANNLGSQRLGGMLHYLAWRGAPAHPEACYFRALLIFHRRGPLPAWRFLRQQGDLSTAEPSIQAAWFAAHGHVLAMLRDFEAADQWIARALEIGAELPWIWLEQSHVLESQDRHEESLESSRRSLELHPWYRPAVQFTAHRLVQLNRDDEALALLNEAAGRLESGDVLGQLAYLQNELGLHQEARANFEKIEEFQPLMHLEKGRRAALAASCSDAAYYSGDHAAAARYARLAEQPLYEKLAERLEKGEAARRVLLPVKFVRQHHVTCAPATLTALSSFWSMPADHLDVAEKICYDGTPAHSERRWADENGFVAREFCVTWDSATALLDRGVPFTLTTVAPGMGHLQSVIGYDQLRGSLLIRDPGERHFREFLAEALFESHKSSGPRGMLMVPSDKATLFAGIELPDAELYDFFYRIQRALESHRRDEARGIYEQMRGVHAGHRLTAWARRSMAAYDSDNGSLLRCDELLLQQFPDDTQTLLSKLHCLAELGRNQERTELLSQRATQQGQDPIFCAQYAADLVGDARLNPRVEELLKRALRYRPNDSRSLSLLAEVRTSQSRHAEALELFRFAACLDDMNEFCARNYFQAAQSAGQTEVALRWLRDRFQRFGGKSSWPARTLCSALDRVDRTKEAFSILQDALSQRPRDGELLLYAADLCLRYGKQQPAQDLLAKARGKTHPVEWLRAAANQALFRDDKPAALEYWRQVLKLEPQTRDANAGAAGLLSQLQGDEAALAHLRSAVERFPHNFALRVLLIDQLRNTSPDEVTAALDELVERFPSDAWAQRERAIWLCQCNNWDEALKAATVAEQLDPISPVVPYIRGQAHRRNGEVPQAKAQFRQTLRLSIDYDLAISNLIEICATRAERSEELRFIFDELKRQVMQGDGLLSYREYALGTLDAEELLGLLRQALDARPDLWHAWVAVGRQLLDMSRLDDAHSLAVSATQQFPLLPRIWLELAAICRQRHDFAGEVDALKKAWAINPSWGEPGRQLAETYKLQGQPALSRQTLERTLKREPDDARNYGHLADLLWTQGEREEALSKVQAAVRVAPGYDWAWDKLREWSNELNRPELVLEQARELTRTRPHEPRSWLVLADMLDQPAQRDECLAAIDRVLAIDPRNVHAHEAKAKRLAADGQFDEALQACSPPVFVAGPPQPLAILRGEILMQRGDAPAAIAELKRLLQGDPDCYVAWGRLATWHEESDPAEYLAAAQQMARIDPRRPVSWGYLAEARLKNGDRAGAKRDFQRAIEIAPDYLFAESALFDLQLEDGEFDEAERTLQHCAASIPRPWLLSDKAKLATHRGDWNAAVPLVQQLCVTPMENPGPLDSLIGAMFKANWGQHVEPVLGDMLARPDVQPQAGWVWMNLASSLEIWPRMLARLNELAGRGALYSSAAEKYIHEAADAQRPDLVLDLMQRHGQHLHERTETWYAVINALHLFDRDAELLHWSADWRTRTDKTGRMLFPIALSLWTVKRDSEAVEVGRAALELPPDSGTAVHQLLLSVHELQTGGAALAAGWLRLIDPDALPPFYQALYRLESILATLLASIFPAEQRKPLYKQTVRQLDKCWKSLPEANQKDQLLRRIYQALRDRLAKYLKQSPGWPLLRMFTR
ncbi:MAG: tetratricopeptide repeat protein [Pirellulales bacterium]